MQVKFCSDPVRSEDYFPEWKPALRLCSDFEGDFGQTMELLEMDIEEIQVNVEHSLDELYVI